MTMVNLQKNHNKLKHFLFAYIVEYINNSELYVYYILIGDLYFINMGFPH